MYFWRIELLKSELRRGPLSQRAAFGYILATLVTYAVLTGFPGAWNNDPTPPTVTDWIGFVAAIFITVSGTYASYRANGAGVGEDFASRYFALGWVLGIRLMVMVVVPLILGVFLFLYLIRAEPTDAEICWLAVGTAVAVQLVFYRQLWSHIGQLARSNK